jgi:hypothetical protein
LRNSWSSPRGCSFSSKSWWRKRWVPYGAAAAAVVLLAGLRGRTEELMGAADEGFALVDPVATGTVSARQAQSHLLLGILYAQAGVRDEADRHLLQVRPTDPGYEVARRTRDRLR